MLLAGLFLALCALSPCPAVLGAARPQLLVERSGSWMLRRADGFSWEDCGNGQDPVVIQSLSVSPDPVSIPGNLSISAAVSSSVAITSPLKVVLVVEKALGDLWIQLPCVDQLGSCTYDDVCTILDDLIPPGTSCPEPLLTYGIPCHCPFKAGSYSLPTSDFTLPEIELPSWLTNGNYRVQAVVSNNDEELACIKLGFSLKSQ
ncbi:ganglioside GM2 activator [Lagopus muta]|uniref:ganglioside GM2 activator n=1 Tax=Lagopus muta TaxID=64668 RepID=UPI0020A1298F|nr:ganglioside GM2 activator [Lagopus muta]